MLDFLIIVQARLGSTRFPGKVMKTVEGIPIVKRVWLAAKGTGLKTIVAWPERYPDLDENNVLERFKRIHKEFPSKFIIRLTADCPLLTTLDILEAIDNIGPNAVYYCNRRDGHDVQIFSPGLMYTDGHCDTEHVIHDKFPTERTYLSVDTLCDLERVRRICKIKPSL